MPSQANQTKRNAMNRMVFYNPKSVGRIIQGEILIQTIDNNINIDITNDIPYILPHPRPSIAERNRFYKMYQQKYIAAKKMGKKYDDIIRTK